MGEHPLPATADTAPMPLPRDPPPPPGYDDPLERSQVLDDLVALVAPEAEEAEGGVSDRERPTQREPDAQGS